MAEHVIRLPDVGEGIAEAELVEWHVKVGDLVRADAALAAVMTDKATVEIPSPVDGEIIWLGAEIGERVAVGSDLVRLKVPGERDAASAAQPLSAPADAPKPAPAAERRVADREERGTPRVTVPTLAPRPAQSAEPRPAAHATARARAAKPVASPTVRQRARESGIDLRQVPGTGPAGRITHEDLDAFAAGDPRVARSPALQPKSAVEDIKVIGLRRRIAEQMAVAHARIPHITYVEEVDVTALEELR
ncbi:MAG TPA: biotin/lipoyl-containing protein, partial [Xanthobacteraceae bacterium]